MRNENELTRLRTAPPPARPATTARAKVGRSFNRTSASALATANSMNASSRKPSTAHQRTSRWIARPRAAPRPTSRENPYAPSRYAATTASVEKSAEAALTARFRLPKSFSICRVTAGKSGSRMLGS